MGLFTPITFEATSSILNSTILNVLLKEILASFQPLQYNESIVQASRMLLKKKGFPILSSNFFLYGFVYVISFNIQRMLHTMPEKC